MNIRIPNPILAALGFLLLVLLLIIFAWGVLAQRNQWFPHQYFAEIEQAITMSVDSGAGGLEWYYKRTERTDAVIAADSFTDSRLNLMTSMGADKTTLISVVAPDGRVLNEVAVDWFEIWPDPQHIPERDIPKAKPGNHLHGAAMLPNGDVVFNFEQLGLVRVTPCGEVVWKLAYRTHHSVFLDENGDLWVSGQITREIKQPDFPNHKPPYREPTVLQVSTEGEILKEISLFDVFVANDLRGFLHMATMNNTNTIVTGDTLHLNDVERFPASMEPGVFRHGDIMVSLRNVSTVLVFDPETLQIRFRTTGAFTRQHDPAFIDGNTLSVFDNNLIGPAAYGQQSRILVVDALTGAHEVWYQGSESEPFYTNIMGKTQWLEDQNLVVVDARDGRAFQLDKDRQIVWDYINLVDEGVTGIVEQMQRLPAEYSEMFVTPQAERCAAP